MRTEKRLDGYNKSKVWTFKVSDCGHYYLGQQVGNNHYKLARVRKSFYDSVYSSTLPMVSPGEVMKGLQELSTLVDWNYMHHSQMWGLEVLKWVRKGLEAKAKEILPGVLLMDSKELLQYLLDLYQYKQLTYDFPRAVIAGVVNYLDTVAHDQVESDSRMEAFRRNLDSAHRAFMAET